MARFDLEEARQDYREAVGDPVRLIHKKDEDMTTGEKVLSTENTYPDSPLANLRERSLSAAFFVGARDVDEAIAVARKMVDFVLEANDAEIIRAAREFADQIKG